MTISEQMAEFLLTMTYDQLPPSVVANTKKLILDHLGVAAVGASMPWGQIVNQVALSRGGNGPASVYFSKDRVAPTTAALINGTYAHGFELDDHCMRVHCGCVVIPAAIAASQQQGSIGGRELITAIVLGYEVLIRLGPAMGGLSQIGHHDTGTRGAIGAAVAAGKIMRLAHQPMVWALGLAGNFPTGVCEYFRGSMEKRIFAGRASEGGVLACELAQHGFTGPSTIFEGEFGFCHAFSRDVDLDWLLKDLGTRFYIEDTRLKRYSCSGNLRPFIEAALTLKEQHQDALRHPERVREVLIEGEGQGLDPRRIEVNVQDVMGAQYSTPYAVAVTLCRGRPALREFTVDIIRSQDVQSMLRRVTVRKRNGIPGLGNITVTLEDGISWSTPVTEIEETIADIEKQTVVEKFLDLTLPLIGEQPSVRLIEVLDHLEDVRDISDLADAIPSSIHRG